jgi:hypothetical protein
MWDGCREMAKHDSDFDPIRDEPAFQALLGAARIAAPPTLGT